LSDPLAPHVATPRELKSLLAAERDGAPFLAYRDREGALRIFVLPSGDAPLLIGRRDGVDVQLAWDAEASGVHAELRCLGGEWTVVDDGLSTNGTFVNTRRVNGRQRLRDGDRLRIGVTVLAFNAAVSTPIAATTTGELQPQIDDLSDTQRRVLVALCRPQLTAGAFHAPASNQSIAAEIFLSVDTVKTQLRAMFAKYSLDELPQNQKRAALAELALRVGLVSSQDL
jgi:pSer/pThr/pTyr-binding forkhead associated (FHA) protein